MSSASARQLEASIYVDASAEAVWQLVSDIRRTGEWSPECLRVVVWGRGAVRRGTRFTGFNRRKLVWWPTSSRIHRYDEGRAIGWTVYEHRARWSYELGAEGEGTRLTERREMPHGESRLADAFGGTLLGGVDSHTDELVEGMHTTLQRIKPMAEAA